MSVASSSSSRALAIWLQVKVEGNEIVDTILYVYERENVGMVQ